MTHQNDEETACTVSNSDVDTLFAGNFKNFNQLLDIQTKTARQCLKWSFHSMMAAQLETAKAFYQPSLHQHTGNSIDQDPAPAVNSKRRKATRTR